VLRALRARRGLSQLAAADAAGMQPQTVRQLEQAGGDPRLGTLRRYAAGLGCGVELVLRDADTGDAVGRVAIASGTDAPPLWASAATDGGHAMRSRLSQASRNPRF
jgi:transcriptional regulator with XRE-family HTH domain